MVRCKKALSLVLALVMMLGMIPFNMNANADGETFTITWKDGDKTLYSTTANKGESYKYEGQTPEKASDAMQKWIFVGWKDGTDAKYYNSFPTAERDVIYTAAYESTERKYTVAFVDDEGKELLKNAYPYNTPAASVEVPAGPAKDPDTRHTYSFIGWELANGNGSGIRNVTEDVVYRPVYATNTRLYTITWKDADGKPLRTDSYEYGTLPAYAGATPTKASDAECHYTFAGWKPAVSAVTGDMTYTAAYSRTLITPDEDFLYDVVWMNSDGTEITTKTTEAGNTPVQPAAPTRDADERYIYTFAGWTPSVKTVTTDAVYTAMFNAAERSYTLKYTTNGTVLETKSGVHRDDIPAYSGALPTKAETKEGRYLFAGWLTSVDTTYGVITRTAKYVTVKNEYPVAFVNSDGKVLQVKLTEFGAVPSKPKDDPTIAKTAQYEYKFNSWSPTLKAVDGNTVYTATYDAKVRDYMVTFVDWDDQVLLGAAAYPYGTILDDMTRPADPVKKLPGPKSYVFNGWADTTDTDKGTTVFKATYIEKDKVVTITWKGDKGSVLETDENVPYSETNMPEYNGETPTKEMTATTVYTFSGWAPALVPTTDDATYTAQFNESVRKYQITWMNGSDVIRVDDVAVGETPEYKGDEPSREPDLKTIHRFVGWEPAAVPVTRDATYYAQFKDENRYYTVTYRFDTQMGESGDLGTSSEVYDAIPTYNGPAMAGKPYKEPTAQYTYEFKEWDESFNNVTSEKTYVAHFTASLRKYNITWVDGNGKMRQYDENVPYGTPLAYENTAPKKANDAAGNQYVWDGTWKDSSGNVYNPATDALTVTGDAVYTAQFTTNYKIDWVNWDGTPLTTTYVPAGETPSYPTGAPTPTRAHPDAPDWRYAWKTSEPWTPAVVPATAPATYTAQFEPQRNQYNITWDYPDPADPNTEVVRPPETVSADDPYNKPGDVPNYPNWVDQDGDPFVPGQKPTKDAIYVPVFDITWDNPNDPDEIVKVPYKQPVNKPDDDKLEGDLENQPWTDQDGNPYAPHPATKPETFKPAFNINWNYPDPANPDPALQDPTVSERVPYDEDVTQPAGTPAGTWVEMPTDPTKPLVYFTPGQKPTKDTTYVPLYTITWGDPDKFHEDKVPYKQPVTKPTDTELPDNVKSKDWVNKDDDTPYAAHLADKDETYQPLFKITWKPENSTEPDKTETVKQGVVPKYTDDAGNEKKPTAPSGKTFSKWDPTPYAADKDQTYTAQYKPVSSGGGGGGGGISTPTTYPITWIVNGNKTVTNVPKGTTPVFPNGTPTKPNATFVRWTPDIVPADGPATYTAVFSDSPNYHAGPDETGIDQWLETGDHVIYYRGYPDGTIKPYGNITRNETAMILYRLLLDGRKPEKTALKSRFNDVPETSWYTDAVLTLADLGIVTGDPEGNFRPTDAITRAEFTAMCVRFVKAQDAHFDFSDVKQGNCWAYKEIMTAAYYGWITGYPDGSFRPNAYIARCEAAAVVNRMLGRAADQEYVNAHESELIYFPDLLKEWYYFEMIEGTNAHDYERVNEKETWKTMYDR